MNGSDLISLAANPALGNAEARFRSAISRAYYGAFHLTVAFLEEFNCPISRNAEGHRQAYLALFNTNVQEAIQAARRLSDLRGERNRADYNLAAAGYNSLANAREKVELAIAVGQFLDRCRVEPARAAVMEGLQQQRE